MAGLVTMALLYLVWHSTSAVCRTILLIGTSWAILEFTRLRARALQLAHQAVVQSLIRGGAIGAFSTHDLALAEIAEPPQCKGVNVHMQAENPDEPLEFDYRLKPGILRQTNALAIVRMIGIELDREVADG